MFPVRFQILSENIMVNFKLLTNTKKLSAAKVTEIINYLINIEQPKTPLKNHEIIMVKETELCCLVVDYTYHHKRSNDRFDCLIIDTIGKGYSVLTVWNEFDPQLPATVFVWHPDGESEYSKLLA